jgi:DNA-binding beta-propeller fold protein YncE
MIGMRTWLQRAAALATLAVGLVTRAPAADYALQARVALPGDGGWDYLAYEASTRRLFVTRGDRVQVVDPRRGTLVAEIGDTPGVHGVAFAAALGRGYTTNGRDDSLTVFDLKTLQILTKIRLPGAEHPDSIVYDAATRRVLAFNGRSRNASIVDPATDRWLANVPLAGRPESAAADGSGRVFVDLEDRNSVAEIDVRAARVVATRPVEGCVEPAGLAMDTAARRLFVGCRNARLLIVDADDGRAIDAFPIGKGVDATVFDPARREVLSSQGDGTLSVIGALPGGRFALRQTLTTQLGARTMALDPRGDHVYLVTAKFEPVAAGVAHPRRTIRPGSVVLLVVGRKP